MQCFTINLKHLAFLLFICHALFITPEISNVKLTQDVSSPCRNRKLVIKWSRLCLFFQIGNLNVY